jgi:hypothetical protein
MGLRMDRLDEDVGRRCQEAVDRVRAGIGLDLVPLNSVQMPANDGRRIIKEYAGHRWQVTDVAVHDAK